MTDTENIKPTENKPKKGSFLKEVIIIFVAALIISVVFRTFIIDTRIVPTPSMVPTVQVGNRLLVNMLSYDFGKTPKLGDIVVFKPAASTGEDSDMLKRVIGTPGDTIEIRDNKVYVNGNALVEPYVAAAPDYEYGPVEVPDGYYFMLGDNRNHSYDSHQWPSPFVPEDSIKGRAFCIYWPIDDMGILERFPE